MLTQRTCTLVFLRENERRILKRIVEDTLFSPNTRRRARALLLSDRVAYPATTDGEVADETGLSPATVGKLRKRYTSCGLTEAIMPLTKEAHRVDIVMRAQPGQPLQFEHFTPRRHQVGYRVSD